MNRMSLPVSPGQARNDHRDHRGGKFAGKRQLMEQEECIRAVLSRSIGRFFWVLSPRAALRLPSGWYRSARWASGDRRDGVKVLAKVF